MVVVKRGEPSFREIAYIKSLNGSYLRWLPYPEGYLGSTERGRKSLHEMISISFFACAIEIRFYVDLTKRQDEDRHNVTPDKGTYTFITKRLCESPNMLSNLQGE